MLASYNCGTTKDHVTGSYDNVSELLAQPSAAEAYTVPETG